MAATKIPLPFYIDILFEITVVCFTKQARINAPQCFVYVSVRILVHAFHIE